MKKLSIAVATLALAGISAPALANGSGFLKVSGQDTWYFSCSLSGALNALLHGSTPWVCA